MRVLVTGATGQLGMAVARALLARGDSVRVLVRDSSSGEGLGEKAVGDVTDPVSLRAAAAGMEAVIHAAGIVSYWKPNRAKQQEVNVGGTRNMLQAAAEAGVKRFVLTSSIAACGYVEGKGEGNEQTAFNWGGKGLGYAETKSEAEKLVLAETRLETMAVRPGMVFGEGDLHRNAGRLLLQLAAGRLKWVPSGCTTAAVLEDVVAGHLSALDRGQAGNSWVLGGSTLSFLELTTRIAAVLKVAPPKGVLPDWVLFGAALASEGLGWWTQKEPVLTRALAEFSVRNRKYSSEKAEKELGYRPQLLEVGIERCWRWYQQQGWL